MIVFSYLLRQLSRITQAFAMAEVYYYPLLNTVAMASRDKLSEFDSGSISNLIRCFGKLGYTVSPAHRMSRLTPKLTNF